MIYLKITYRFQNIYTSVILYLNSHHVARLSLLVCRHLASLTHAPPLSDGYLPKDDENIKQI